MDRRGYYEQSTEVVPTYVAGSLYVEALVNAKNASIAMTALTQAHQVLSEAVSPNGSVLDAGLLNDAKKCIDIALKYIGEIS